MANDWDRIHIDFAGPIEGFNYLIIIDAFSKWPEVVRMKSISSERTIKELNKVFSQFGYLKMLISDNGRQFTTEEFRNFCKTYNMKHIKTPPYHPQSNG